MAAYEWIRKQAEAEQARHADERSRLARIIAGATGCKTATAELMESLGITREDAAAARANARAAA